MYIYIYIHIYIYIYICLGEKRLACPRRAVQKHPRPVDAVVLQELIPAQIRQLILRIGIVNEKLTDLWRS